MSGPAVDPIPLGTRCAGLIGGRQCGATLAAHNNDHNPVAHLFVDPATVPPGNLPPPLALEPAP